MTKINEKILIDAGLSNEQSRVYLFLLENGFAQAKIISTKTGIGRALAYKVLNELEAMKLVEKREDMGKVALFFPAHPQKIKEVVEKQKDEAVLASNNLNSIFGSLASSYNALLSKPNVQFYEGEDGLKTIYEDILDTGKDIFLASSPIEEGRENVLHLIREQIKKQVAQNIKTKAITPLGGQKIATAVSDDEKYLITRKKIPSEKLNIPAQIILYGEKVAITNFKQEIISVVIESSYIHETFQKMFDFIWNHS